MTKLQLFVGQTQPRRMARYPPSAEEGFNALVGGAETCLLNPNR